MMLDWYSLEPPPLPSRSSAPYQPVGPMPPPTLTLQFISTIGLPAGRRQVESPSTIASGISLSFPDTAPIRASALSPTPLLVLPRTRPNMHLSRRSTWTDLLPLGSSV